MNVVFFKLSPCPDPLMPQALTRRIPPIEALLLPLGFIKFTNLERIDLDYMK
jgi:hypothetical protein